MSFKYRFRHAVRGGEFVGVIDWGDDSVEIVVDGGADMQTATIDAKAVKALTESLVGWLLGVDAPAKLSINDGVFSFTLPDGASYILARITAERRLAE